jgi:hypothetical protein
MKQKSYNRYHRFDMSGNKQIKRFELNEIPTDIADEGYTCWTKGTGPFSEQQLLNVQNGLRSACLGVPKKPETKQKMREAKLGKPKTQEHKDNMRKSWYRRKELAERYIVDEKQSTPTTSTIL